MFYYGVHESIIFVGIHLCRVPRWSRRGPPLSWSPRRWNHAAPVCALPTSSIDVLRSVAIFCLLCASAMDDRCFVGALYHSAPSYGRVATCLRERRHLAVQTTRHPITLLHPSSTTLIGRGHNGSAKSLFAWPPSLLKIFSLLSQSITVQRCVGCECPLLLRPLAAMLRSCANWEPKGCPCFQSCGRALVFRAPPTIPTSTSMCTDREFCIQNS